LHLKRSDIKIAAAKPLKSGFKVVQFKMAPFDIRLSIHSKYSSILRFILRLPEHSKFSIFNSCTFGLMCQRANFKYSVADNRVRIIRRRVELNCVAINGAWVATLPTHGRVCQSPVIKRHNAIYENKARLFDNTLHSRHADLRFLSRVRTLTRDIDIAILSVRPSGGAKYRWGIKISRFSTNKSLYLANDTRYRHSYYRRRIGNRTQAFEWHQFQWPWVTSNPDFKVTTLFDVK